MAKSSTSLTVAEVAGWGSALLSFGMVQGALYLKGFWGRFGLDPFQFAGVAELALIGLTAMGLTLGLMAAAALIASCIDAGESPSRRRRVAGLLSGACFAVGFVYLVWVSGAWPLVIAAVVTIALIVMIRLSPVAPRAVKDSPWLPYGALAIVYVSFASAYLGHERAKSIMVGARERTARVVLAGGEERVLVLVGRLGDTYVFWNKQQAEAVLIPREEVKAVAVSVKVVDAG